MNDTISARELASAWSAFGQGADVLSLDCFDTLIWRDTAAPTDVFCELTPPVTPAVRVVAERTARARARAVTGYGEVRLADIYRCALPGAEPGVVDARIAEELELEKRFCRAFAPAVELIRSAKAAGKRVIVVSDTYFDARQLATLIDAAAGSPLARLIDAFFCSCEYGVSKSEGLFGHVLRWLRVAPQRVLHVGDNAAADLDASRALGMRAVQLLQGDTALSSQWRMESAALLMIDPRLRQSRAPQLPYRRLLASAMTPEMSAAERLGYGSLGPLMHTFATWVRAEARAIAASSGPVKICFLMRDGHLPLLAYRQLGGTGDPPAFALEISRFSAIAASLRTRDEVLDYFALVEDGISPEAAGRQLLLKPHEVERLAPAGAPERGRRLRLAALRANTLKEIAARSEAYRKRLFEYLRRTVEPQPGETLMLVDLGYAGTVQNRLQDLIERQFGVAVTGRYLLLRDVPRSGDRKRGLFGPDRLDARALELLLNFVAALEQVCTAQFGSVIDYTSSGEPLRKPTVAAAAGAALRAEVQQACLRFVSDAARFEASEPVDGAVRWQAALAACARLLLLPARG
ncbi:MAG TPA: HAD family hydrolase, partial [Burkholderiaceae bacterium]|nr:HAD family hydrolase [Burkholderiaceae bacterium]